MRLGDSRSKTWPQVVIFPIWSLKEQIREASWAERRGAGTTEARLTAKDLANVATKSEKYTIRSCIARLATRLYSIRSERVFRDGDLYAGACNCLFHRTPTSGIVARVFGSRSSGGLSLGSNNNFSHVLDLRSSCRLRICDGGESTVGLGDSSSAGRGGLRSRYSWASHITENSDSSRDDLSGSAKLVHRVGNSRLVLGNKGSLGGCRLSGGKEARA